MRQTSDCVSLTGKYAWISGGVQGLGYEFARSLLANGASGVCIVDIASEVAGAAAVENLIGETSSVLQKQCCAIFLRCDVRDATATKRCMQQAFDSFGGRLDIVVNNAGIADERDVDNILAVNLHSVITATEFALLLMSRNSKEQDARTEPCIINVASAAGIFPMASAPVYAATKSGVVGYSLSRASSAWRQNVRVNALCPGPARTALTAGKEEHMKDTGVGLMEAETVAGALLHIISSSGMHGEALYVSERSGIFFPLRALVGELRKAIRRQATENGLSRDQRHARL